MVVLPPTLCSAVGLAVLVALALFAGGAVAARTRPAYARRVYAATTYAAVLLLWPLLFDCLVGVRLIAQMPLLAIALLWPYALIGLNIAHAHRARDTRVHARSHVQMDASQVTSLGLAVGGAVASQLGKQTAQCTSAIFTTAIGCCLAFVLPHPEIPEDYHLAVVIESLQQAALHIAVALLLAGITINLSVSVCMRRAGGPSLADVLRDLAPKQE